MKERTGGVVKWFNDAKGFGFIRRDDGDRDLFVHFKGIRGDGFRTLKEGQRVSFLVGSEPKGPIALDVALEDAAEVTAEG